MIGHPDTIWVETRTCSVSPTSTIAIHIFEVTVCQAQSSNFWNLTMLHVSATSSGTSHFWQTSISNSNKIAHRRAYEHVFCGKWTGSISPAPSVHNHLFDTPSFQIPFQSNIMGHEESYIFFNPQIGKFRVSTGGQSPCWTISTSESTLIGR